MFLPFNSNITGGTCRAATANPAGTHSPAGTHNPAGTHYPAGTHNFIPGFYWVPVI